MDKKDKAKMEIKPRQHLRQSGRVKFRFCRAEEKRGFRDAKDSNESNDDADGIFRIHASAIQQQRQRWNQDHRASDVKRRKVA